MLGTFVEVEVRASCTNALSLLCGFQGDASKINGLGVSCPPDGVPELLARRSIVQPPANVGWFAGMRARFGYSGRAASRLEPGTPTGAVGTVADVSWIIRVLAAHDPHQRVTIVQAAGPINIRDPSVTRALSLITARIASEGSDILRAFPVVPYSETSEYYIIIEQLRSRSDGVIAGRVPLIYDLRREAQRHVAVDFMDGTSATGLHKIASAFKRRPELLER